MKQVHMILQSVDGIGKSFVAFLLAQHFMERGEVPICMDGDRVHQTFSSFKPFQAKPFEIIEGENLNIQAFDDLTTQIKTANDNSTFIIDFGANAFVPLTAWMLEQKTAELFQDTKIELFIHTVLAGGPTLEKTMVSLSNLLTHFPDFTFVVWLNAHFGMVKKGNTPFEDTDLFQNHQHQIHALVNIPALQPQTFGFDLGKMLEAQQTFNEALQNSAFSIFSRQRLVMTWRNLNAQIHKANL